MNFAAAVDRANASVFRHLSVAAVLDDVAVSGIFDNGYREALSGLGAGIGVQEPSFTLPSADCAEADQGSTLSVGADSYTVRGIEPDGTGVAVLRLTKAA